MPISKKDEAKVRLGNKRVRDWNEYRKTPAYNPVNKDGTPKQIRLRGIHWGGTIRPDEVIDRDESIRSGGVTPGVSIRSADAKFGKYHREHGDLFQGKVQVSTIDGHVYGSTQRVGRSLDEIAHDEGCGRHGAVIAGKGTNYTPVAAKPRPDSPFKRAGKSAFTVVIKKG